MAYTLKPEPNEKVEAHVQLHLSQKTEPFHFAVSNQALYLPRKKLIAKTDPYYFQRVPLSEVQQVVIRRLRPYALWLLAVLMITGGLISIITMLEPIVRDRPGSHAVSGWPFALVVGGLILPFAARARFGLEIRWSDKAYRWKPPLVVDKRSKLRVLEALQTIIAACEKIGVRVSDQRTD